MNTNQIENLLRADCKLSTTFDGVFASDLLPLVCDPVGTAMVMNLDSSREPGSHWVCLYIENGRGEYFDSYGLPPMVEEFEIFLNRNCWGGNWTYNRQELQALDSQVCGHYCIWFLGQRARGRSMGEIVNEFSPQDSRKNDTKVENCVLARYGRIAEDFTSEIGKCVQCCCPRAGGVR